MAGALTHSAKSAPLRLSALREANAGNRHSYSYSTTWYIVVYYLLYGFDFRYNGGVSAPFRNNERTTDGTIRVVQFLDRTVHLQHRLFHLVV